MPTIEELLDDIFAGHERLSRDEIHRRAVAADLAARDLAALDALPEGEYAQDEVTDAIGTADPDSVGPDPDAMGGADLAGPDDEEEGVDPAALDDETLLRELASLHR